MRTGGVVVHVPLVLSAPEIGYDRLGQAVAKYVGPAFVAGAQALPVPETNLVELSRRLKQQDDREKETNI